MFKLKDFVKVKTNLKVGEEYGNVMFVQRMEETQGKVYRICKVDKDCDFLIEDKQKKEMICWYSETMLEPLKEKEALNEWIIEGI